MDNSEEKSTQNLSPEGILTAKVHRKYLHSNSTSHTWPFSAVAELIDNAYDADVEARRLRIDVEDINAEKCLSFTDDGRGMTPDKLYRMLSFGFCDKEGTGGGGGGRIRGSTRSQVPLGQYGNGFKSGSMRLGKDALVFTRASAAHPVPLGDGGGGGGGGGKRTIASGAMTTTTMSVGFLSQTFLEEIGSETVLVPIATWTADTKELMQPIGDRSIDYILSHSIFSSSEELFKQFDSIESETGTRIIIYNLTKGLDTLFELDFESNLNDICLNPEMTETNDGASGELPLYRTSLKEYCAILFLYSRLTIVLRKREVKSKRLLQNLIKKQKEFYKPRNQDKTIMISFGMWDKERAFIDKDYGALYYYKNRLIKAYEKTGCQKKNEGIGVIAILEVPHGIESIVPVHNKQEFLESSRFSSLVKELTKKLNSYCNEIGLKAVASRSTGLKEEEEDDDEDRHRNRIRPKTKRPKHLNVKDLIKVEKGTEEYPDPSTTTTTTTSSSSSSLVQSPLATSMCLAPLVKSLIVPSSQLSTTDAGCSSADVDGGLSWVADASSGKGLPWPGGASALVPPATASDDETDMIREPEEEGKTRPNADEIVVNETQPDASIGFPSSAATVAMPTVSMESADAIESSIAAADRMSAERRGDPNRQHVTSASVVDIDMTSSDDVRQEVKPSDNRAFSLGGRESKYVQTEDDDAAADDVMTLPTVARQLELLRLNVSRLLSRRRRVMLPGLSVDRLEEVDSKLGKFLLEESIDDDGGQRTSEGRRIQTKTSKQEDDDETSLDDDVKRDVIKLEDFRPKESDSKDATEAKIMTSEEKSSLDDVKRRADDRVPVAEERSTWHSRLSGLCRQPLHSYSSIGTVTAKSTESSCTDRTTLATSTSKKRERISSRIEEFFSFSFKRQRNDE